MYVVRYWNQIDEDVHAARNLTYEQGRAEVERINRGGRYSIVTLSRMP